MAGLKKVFQKFSTQMDIYALVVLIAFFFMVRPVEEIKDIQISGDGNYLYLALGKRGIRVLDISNPGKPKDVGKYDTFNSANALAVKTQGDEEMLFVADGKSGVLGFNVSKHVDEETNEPIDPVFKWDDKTFRPAVDIAVIDKYAFVARDDEGLSLVKIDELPTQGDYHWAVEGVANAQKVIIHGSHAYVIDGDWNLRIFEFKKPGEIPEIGSFYAEVPVNDIYIYEGAVYLATEGKGLVLLNVDDPNNITIIKQYEDAGINIQSVSVYGSFAYIGAGVNGLQILDISDPGQIVRVDKVKKDNDGEKVQVAQKLFFHNDYIYVGDGLTGLKTIHTGLDLEISNLETGEALRLGQQSKVIDVAIAGKYAYLAGGERGLWVLNINKPDTPVDYPAVDDTVGDYAAAVLSRGNYVYVAYKTKGLAIYASGAQKATSVFEGEGEYLDLAMKDDRYLYVAAGPAGLRIIDLSNFVQPKEAGFQDTPGNAVGLFVLDDYAFVADAGEGVQIISILDPLRPASISSIDTKGEATAVTLHKFKADQNSPEKLYAFIADGSNGVMVFDVSNPFDPREITRIETSEFAQDVFTRGNQLYLAERSEGLVIYDISNPENPLRRGAEDTPGAAVRLTLEGDYAYVADDSRGLKIIKVTNPDDPIMTGSYDKSSDAKDFIIQDDKIYLVDGKEGMWVMELEDSMAPSYKNFVDTPGEAKGIDVRNGKAYIADGRGGLQIIDITNPISVSITGAFRDFNNVNDVSVDDTYAYLANGFDGLEIVTITNTANIRHIGHFGTQGAALALDVDGPYAYIATTESRLDMAYLTKVESPTRIRPSTPFNSVLKDTQNVFVSGGRAYILDGENGLFVYDVGKPFSPALIYSYDTPGQLKDIAINDNYAFLADGKSGVEVLYLSDSGTPQGGSSYRFADSAATEIMSCDTPDAQAIAVPSRRIVDKDGEKRIHFYVYVATGECGLISLDATIKVAPKFLDLYITPGDATFGRVAKDYGKATLATILKVYDRRSEAPIWLLPSIAREEAVIHYGAIHPTVKDTAVLFVFGVFLLTVGLLFWLALTAYFVLPVKTGSDGWQSYWRLFLFFRGMHGPIEFAREGQRETSDSRLVTPDRPGVVRVDLNSAVVVEEYPPAWLFARGALRRLQRRRRQRGETLFQTRAVGPGMVFLRSFERIRGVADLRPQFRGRLKVHANTRDGIELYANAVFTGFTLGEKPDVLLITYDGDQVAENLKVIIKKIPRPDNDQPGPLVEKIIDFSDELDLDDKKEAHRFIQRNRNQIGSSPIYQVPNQRKNPPFLFDPERVFNAISSKPYDTSEGRISEWTELPAHAAAGLYRNLIGSELFDNISQPADQKEFPLLKMKGMLSRQLRNMSVLAYQYVENLDGSPITVGQTWVRDQLNAFPVQEFRTPKPLRSRGIKTRFSGFTELMPKNKAVTHHLIDYWRSEWQKDATIIEADHDLQAMRIRNLARTQAQTDLVNTLAMILGDSNYTQEALALRVLQALETAAADPDTRRLLPRDTVRILRNLRELLLPE